MINLNPIISIILLIFSTLTFAEDSLINNETSNKLVELQLNDGQLIKGILLKETQTHYHIKIATADLIIISKSAVKTLEVDSNSTVKHNGEIWNKDPNSTRYFYSPSAFLLEKGDGYFSQKELFFSSIGYGVSDNLSVQIGSILPLMILGSESTNVILAAKTGFSPNEKVHLAAGAQAFIFSAGSLLLPFGVVTLGDQDMNLSLNYARPIFSSETDLVNNIMSLSGNIRLSKNVALITENFLFNDEFGNIMFAGGGIRMMGKNIAFDVGAFSVLDSLIPIPWLDVTYNF